MHRTVLGALLAVAVLAAELPTYPVKPAAEYPSAQFRSDLTVAAVALDNGEDQRTYFGAELRPRGYRPVLIVVENRGRESCILDRDKLTFSNAVTKQGTPQSPETPRKTESALRIASVVPTLPTLMAGVLAAGLTNTRHVLLATELQSATISPGSSVHGFIFVPVRKMGRTPQPVSVEVPLMSAVSGVTTIFEFHL